MVDQNETYAQGSEPGDAPIESETVPIAQEVLDSRRRQVRLTGVFRDGVTPQNVVQVVQDLVDEITRP